MNERFDPEGMVIRIGSRERFEHSGGRSRSLTSFGMTREELRLRLDSRGDGSSH
jgi:hypothetical protein